MARRAGITQLTLVTPVAGILACPGTARAHEKWFYDATLHPTRWEQAFQFPGIVGVGVAVVLTVIAGLAWRSRRCLDRRHRHHRSGADVGEPALPRLRRLLLPTRPGAVCDRPLALTRPRT